MLTLVDSVNPLASEGITFRVTGHKLTNANYLVTAGELLLIQ